MADARQVAAANDAVEDDLLCIADTKVVLGNWFAECVTNGKSLPDFAAMLGMCTASYGQTRAIYRYLDTCGYSYKYLESGRSREDIRSMEMLDEPPRNWQDFILTTWLAEMATWSMGSAYVDHPDRTVAGIVRKIGEEAYFHLKYSVGWFRIMQASDVERKNVAEAVSHRLPAALQWFGNPDHDEANREGAILADIRAGFICEVEKALTPLAINVDELSATEYGPSWRPTMRRNGALSDRLFEVIRFKDSDLAAR